jgi:hypothetical protein
MKTVAVSGSTAVVGAAWHADKAGSAYVFQAWFRRPQVEVAHVRLAYDRSGDPTEEDGPCELATRCVHRSRLTTRYSDGCSTRGT